MNKSKLILFGVTLLAGNTISAATTRVVENQIDMNKWPLFSPHNIATGLFFQ